MLYAIAMGQIITVRHIPGSTCGQLSQTDCSQQQGDQIRPLDQDPYDVFYPVAIETASLPSTTWRSNWSSRLENAPSTSLAIQRRRRICFSSCPWHFKAETRFLFKVPWLRAKALQSVITALHALHAKRSSQEKAVRLSVCPSVHLSNAWIVIKQESFALIFIPYERLFSLVF